MTSIKIPCPYCADGFTTSGDRHARTKQDVCPNCEGTAIAPARTGETPATSFAPSLTNPNPKREGPNQARHLTVNEPTERAADAIYVHDEDDNDIATFFHSEHATVGQSYETALRLATLLVEANNGAIASARPSPRYPVRAALEGLVKSLDDLIADSEGVAGLHRNGDVATWDELTSGGRFEDWLSSLDAARAALSVSTPTGEGEEP